MDSVQLTVDSSIGTAPLSVVHCLPAVVHPRLKADETKAGPLSTFSMRAIHLHLRQVLKFAMTGGSAAVIDFGILNTLVKAASWDPRIAVIPSTLTAATYVFLMNRSFTFRSRNTGKAKEAVKFAIVYGLAILFNYLLFRIFLDILEPYEDVLPLLASYNYAKVFAIGIVAVWNYTLSHFFVFKQQELPKEEVVVF